MDIVLIVDRGLDTGIDMVGSSYNPVLDNIGILAGSNHSIFLGVL